MPTTYSLTASGKGIKIIPSAGPSIRFTRPVIVAAALSSDLILSFPDLASAARPDVIELTQGQKQLLIAYADITTVGGVAKSGTLTGVLDQIVALLPTGSGNSSDPAIITQDSTHRFVTDAQVTAWDAKQAALGYAPLNPANNLSGLANLVTARSNLGLGSMSTQAAGSVAITGGTVVGVTSVSMATYNTSDSQLKVGSLEVQGYATTNTFVSSNVYYDGAGFKHRVTGGVSMINLTGSEIHMRLAASASAGATATNIGLYTQFKIDNSGNMAVGAGLSTSASTWTGALLFVVSATGEVLINSTTLVASSVFTVVSTAKGSVPAPKMTTTQRDAISAPTEGLQVYSLTTHTMDFFNGTVWKTVTTN